MPFLIFDIKVKCAENLSQNKKVISANNQSPHEFRILTKNYVNLTGRQ